MTKENIVEAAKDQFKSKVSNHATSEMKDFATHHVENTDSDVDDIRSKFMNKFPNASESHFQKAMDHALGTPGAGE